MTFVKSAITNSVYEDNVITMITDKGYYITTKPASEGRWYYEFTHIQGDCFHYVGFAPYYDKYQGFFFYPQGESHIAKFFRGDNITAYIDNSSNHFDQYQDIGLVGLDKNHTIGLAFDSYSMIFTIYYETQIKRFSIKYQQNYPKPQKFSPFFSEAYDDYLRWNDTISLNFGEKPFRYNLPQGYLPWKSALVPISCCKNDFIIDLRYLLFIFINSH